MSTALDYALRLNPRRFQILGVKLHPLSLGHYLLMTQHGLPFIADGDATAEPQDLFLAILICSKHWKDGEFEQHCETTDFEEVGTKWGNEMGKQIAEDFAKGILFDINEKIRLFSVTPGRKQ